MHMHASTLVVGRVFVCAPCTDLAIYCSQEAGHIHQCPVPPSVLHATYACVSAGMQPMMNALPVTVSTSSAGHGLAPTHTASPTSPPVISGHHCMLAIRNRALRATLNARNVASIQPQLRVQRSLCYSNRQEYKSMCT